MSQRVCEDAGAEVVPADLDGDAAVAALYRGLLAGEWDAVVLDHPQVVWHLRRLSADQFTLLPPFGAFSYGLMFPQGSPLREPVNEALLHWVEKGHQEVTVGHYLNTRTDGPDDPQQGLERYTAASYVLAGVIALFAVCAVSAAWVQRKRAQREEERALEKAPVEVRYAPGTKVRHPTRGTGEVDFVKHDDTHGEPGAKGELRVHVLFDSGEEHSYKVQSLHKLTILRQRDQLDKPARPALAGPTAGGRAGRKMIFQPGTPRHSPRSGLGMHTFGYPESPRRGQQGPTFSAGLSRMQAMSPRGRGTGAAILHCSALAAELARALLDPPEDMQRTVLPPGAARCYEQLREAWHQLSTRQQHDAPKVAAYASSLSNAGDAPDPQSREVTDPQHPGPPATQPPGAQGSRPAFSTPLSQPTEAEPTCAATW